jgi:two-component system NtrC family response regulator
MEPIRILVLDDEKNICSGCRLALSDAHYSADTFLTGRAGLDAALKGNYDVMLLDMKLPDMDGMDILRAVRKEKPGTYVIVMTGHSTVQNAVDAMKLGVFDYLCKPFTDDELVLAVSRAVEKKQLVEENLSLRKELIVRFGSDNIVGKNPSILRVFEQIQKVAPTDSTVLIYGESGTGKELVARAIHGHSHRATRQFFAVDCSSLSSSLLESELFGHVKGAFTGATESRAGIFEAANGGTLFLDDVANLTRDIQAKLLRVLETYEFKPVGADRFKKTNVRIIAATNKDLRTMVADERFREDLFYRLNVFLICLPPLRERKDDIPKLAYHFLKLFCRKTGKQIEGFSAEALEALVEHDWPGNVRQLKNIVERLVITFDAGTVDLGSLLDQLQTRQLWRGDTIPDTLDELKALKRHLLKETFGQIERAFIVKALKMSEGNISRAAQQVGMQRPNFHALMRKYHISAGTFKNADN